MSKPNRSSIPVSTAARLLFLSDRTCCVCRVRGKPVQIHHLDDNPKNHEPSNLAVLCLDCHRDTQIKGGFDRKLDAAQVVLYRDDWHGLVSRNRVIVEADSLAQSTDASESLEVASALAEIYRETGELGLLAHHYDRIGNKELRDKYIELALANNSDDYSIIDLRTLQGRPDLVPPDVVDRELKRYTASNDILQRARFYLDLRRHPEAARDYVAGILECLRNNEVFSAAYYLKELSKSGLRRELFLLALEEQRVAGNLWWPVRALDELGYEKELTALVLDNEAQIHELQNPILEILLARAKGDDRRAIELTKGIARTERTIGGGIVGWTAKG